MRRALKVAGWTLAVLAALPVLAVLAVWGALNTEWGRGLLEREAGPATGGAVTMSGLSGRFPEALRLRRLELHDAQGVWLVADGIVLDWSPARLFSKVADIQALTAERMEVLRRRVSDSSGSYSLPVRVVLRLVRVDRLQIDQAVAGTAAVLGLDGHADVTTMSAGSLALSLRPLDGGGAYTLDGTLAPDHATATLDLSEPPGGLIAGLAHLPDLGALNLHAHVDGPTAALATQLALAAGPLRADAHGTVDVPGQSADLDLAASAPAMTPRVDVSWQSIGLDAHVHGQWTKPDASGTLRVAGLQAAGSAVQTVAADVAGNAGHVGLAAVLTGLRLAGPAPDLLAAAPVRIKADAQLDDPARPVTFALSHPLLTMDGSARTAGDLSADVNLGLPALQPFAAVAGVDIEGNGRVKLHAAQTAGATMFALDGAVGITGGLAPLPALIGPDATFAVRATLDRQDIAIQSAQLDGRTVHATVSGTDKAGVLDLAYKLGLTDLTALAARVGGDLQAQGTVAGPPDDLVVAADVRGDVAAGGQSRGPIKVTARVTGLPAKPAGHVDAEGTLAGAPLALAVDATRGTDGVMHADIGRADWRSLHAEGALALAPGATLPTGKVALRMTRLDDLRPFVGQAVTGSITADADLGTDTARLSLDAQNAGIPGSRVGRADLLATIAHPLADPALDARLTAEGIDAGGVTGAVQLTAGGPLSALALKLAAQVQASGQPVDAHAAATVDVPGKRVELASLQAVVKGQTVRLLQPARIAYGGPVTIDRLRVGVQTAVLELAGRVSPTLDVTATLRGVDAALAKNFAPDLQAAGTVTADAHITGTPAAPAGTMRVDARGMRLLSGPARALPPANLAVTATLNGRAARLDARLDAGPSANLALNGTAPLGAGALDLRTTGGVDLRLLNPILTASGRRAQGRVTLDVTATGSLAAPRVGGTVQLANGEVQDFGAGVRISALNGTLQAQGDTIRVASLTGQAGPGAIAVTGTVGVLRPGLPVDLVVTMRNARPLSSDLLTATLDSDVAIKGEAAGALSAAGTVAITEADINIPARLPASVAVLNVRRPGDKPPPPPGAARSIGLNLTVTAQRVFLRGRGLDSELGGKLQLRGSSTAPQVSGGFDMRRGSISLAGTTLQFTRGKVGFDGTGVNGKIDPTLDFEADSVTSSITATLLVGGFASAPKITLKSTPDLPQDEVLAYLLFKRSAAELGPFQIAEIAAGLAELSGVGGGGLNPLDRIRSALGLDRLSVGSGGTNSTSSSPMLEAGRYVAKGVYVGAKQGTAGAGTQATVQIDITKGLKLETDAGSGQGANSVGVTYSFDY